MEGQGEKESCVVSPGGPETAEAAGVSSERLGLKLLPSTVCFHIFCLVFQRLLLKPKLVVSMDDLDYFLEDWLSGYPEWLHSVTSA